ncbi:twin transmembrane helix small protein [Brevundimonas naejangsanensis]|uniref:Twin transmembrane helix small protein n=1 Tax=Brevundimonas naejangsanensis TaxID=588932 RepID=A0A494RG38_9CAUL|nr:twin transmembrane helix small protein [Brevundimonas naejangsanensis]AYG94399.1 twin transmembrane helix small protein [Brevundimonas naejangsanensis]
MDLFDILILIAVAAVAVTLGFGVYSLYRGGDFARTYSNKLMRLRIILQALAVLLLIAGMWWKNSHGA